MTRVFADTFYFVALLNRQDEAHQKAVEFSWMHGMPLLTTSWILTELADGLSRSSSRSVFQQLLKDLQSDTETVLVPPTQALFEDGVGLYASRTDKEWSLTDCISFLVMERYGVREALTADHHFEQAGFVCLLK